jgi:hypothetical protein
MLIIFILLSTTNPITRMAFVKIKEPINTCDFKTGTYTNRSRYIYKKYNYRLITYKYSTSFMPSLT